jgi:hypothetical protein
VDPELVRTIALKVVSVFGTGEKKVRFRSSSNAEDQLEFNGDGLYRSVGGCVADDLDEDDAGPSQCDPDDNGEDGVAKSLKQVWASLWNYRAYEKRKFFRIPHQEVHMAVLISEAFPDELVNGVAFTGNPDVIGDRKFLINAQFGDTPVVFTDPGVTAEKDVLVLEDGGVTEILRIRRSSLAPFDQLVLGAHRLDEVLLDFEFKIDRNGKLRFKQVRPFLIATSGDEPPPEFRLMISEGLTSCGGFAENKDPRIIDDYFHLAYTAGHHNDQPPPEHWAIFKPPIDLDGVIVGGLKVVQGFEDEGPSAALLDASLEEIEPLFVESFLRLREGIDPSLFRRGDVDFSGTVNIADAIKILNTVFIGGTPLVCPDAADVDDFGSIDVSDAVLILGYLFLQDESPAEPGPKESGIDVEPDVLAICSGPGCR